MESPALPGSNDASNPVDLWDWAYLYCWKDWLAKLAETALPEKWDFSPNDRDEKDDRPRYAILASYLKYTFWRLEHEEKVREDLASGFAAFNTGLVNRSYEPIFACFGANDRDGARQKWVLLGFYGAGEGRVGDRLVRTFNPLPKRARYLRRLEDVLYDVDQVPFLDYNHILLDNIDRLPRKLLDRELSDSPECIVRVSAAFDGATSDEKREKAFDKLRGLIASDRVHWLRLKNALDTAVDLALERVKWSYRTAVPAYYPRVNSVNLLLPLDLTEDEEPDMALVLERTDSGSYIGQTILTTQMAYCDARLICRPGVDWLEVTFEG